MIAIFLWTVRVRLDDYSLERFAKVQLDTSTIEELTAPTWFDYLLLTITVILAITSLTWVVTQAAAVRRKYLLSAQNLQVTLGTTTDEKTLLRRLGTVSLRSGYGQNGAVGRLTQLVPNRDVAYEDYKSRVVAAKVAEVGWFKENWDRYFEVETLMSTKILYLIQTSLLATKLQSLPLTIVKDYYSILFDWLQEIDFNEDSKYLYPETFQKLIQQLVLLRISPDTLEDLDDAYYASQALGNNHKSILWATIRKLYGETTHVNKI